MLDLVIDHNLVVNIRARSGEDDKVAEIHDLEFGLHLGPGSDAGSFDGSGGGSSGAERSTKTNRTHGAVRIRSNVLLQIHETDGYHRWDVVPGDIIEKYSPRYSPFVLNERQVGEKMYYVPCALCHRGIYEIMLHGCNERKCPESHRSRPIDRSVAR
jgi:hypothetical protein